MKKYLFFLILILNYNVYSQFSTPHVVPSNLEGLNSIFSADFDGDGDQDIVSTSKINSKLVWYENSDGNGTFINQHILETDPDNGSMTDVFAADIDGDNDIDIIATYGYLLVWFKNLDGLGNFSEEHFLSFGDSILSVEAVDIDGDGYKDIIFSDSYGSKLQWKKNTDGQGNFGPNQTISGPIIAGIHYFSVNDFDGDGDMDIVFTDYEPPLPNSPVNNIGWVENTDGNGTFGPEQTILWSAGTPVAVITTDIDNDGYIDIIVASRSFDEVYYFKNLDGLGTFSDKIVLTSSLSQPVSLSNFDFDNDGDQDILVASYGHDSITLFVNDGVGNFNEEITISENADGAISVIVSKIDDDNDIDIISASFLDNVIAWYSNEVNLSIENNDLLKFSVFPNPTASIINIESNSEIIKIEIYNQLGQLVIQNENKDRIDLKGLTKGLYFLKIEDENKKTGIKEIVKN